MPTLLKLRLDQILFPKLTKGAYQFQTLSSDRVQMRMLQANEVSRAGKEDLFTALIHAKDPETLLGFSEAELKSEAGLLIIAGSDTTSTAITATIFYLLHYPAAYARLGAEIRNAFHNVESIRLGSQLNRCKYLRACLDEALRLSPSVGAILPREVLRGGMVVDGTYFPSGTDVGVSAYSLHHDESIFPCAFTYRPERWLEEEGFTQDDVTRAHTGFCPFSIGRTSCIGRNLAYAEMSLTVARMIWLFDMQLAPGATEGEGGPGLGSWRTRRNEFQLYDHFTSTHRGPIVQFKARGLDGM